MGALADLKRSIDLSTLQEKAALVSGGVSGIGALVVETLASHGARVTVADINGQRGKAFVEELNRKGLEINFVATDVTDWTSQVQAFKSAIKFSGHERLDIVVAAAGIVGFSFITPEEEPPSLDRDPPEPSRTGSVFEVNAKGVLFSSKLAQYYFGLPTTNRDSTPSGFRKSLILISSLAGYLELNIADYTASKWAVRGIFRSIRSKMEDLGYRTNLIAPWVMDTPMSKPLADLNREHGFPVGDANAVARTIARCAADDSICGRAIAVGAIDAFDLRDDIEGLNAGVEMKKYLEGEAKDFMAFFGQRP